MPTHCDAPTPNYYQLALAAHSNVDYFSNNPSASTSTATDLLNRQHIGGSNVYPDAATILDLSLPTSIAPLDISWQSDSPSHHISAKQYQTKNQIYYPMPTTNEMVRNPTLEIPKPKTSNLTEKNYQAFLQQQKEREPVRLRALWDSMYHADETNKNPPILDYYSSVGSYFATSASTEAPNKSDISLKEMLNFDELDMSDISNILTIPGGVTKAPKLEQKIHSNQPSTSQTQMDAMANRPEIAQPQLDPQSSKARLNELEVESKHMGILPNLSSFLQDIEYL